MKLCYADEKFLWFTNTPIDKVWGDDWNDAPYEHNAGEPYSEFGPFTKIAIDHGYDLPSEGMLNSNWSVEDINTGAVAWVRLRFWGGRKDICFSAGDELQDVLTRCEEAGIEVYVRKEGGK